MGEVQQGRPEDRRHAAAPAGAGRGGEVWGGRGRRLAGVPAVWSAYQRDTQTAAPQYTFSEADRRVTCYYFYLWDEDFGPAFIKVCAYFPVPGQDLGLLKMSP
jgi:hypothetical protein